MNGSVRGDDMIIVVEEIVSVEVCDATARFLKDDCSSHIVPLPDVALEPSVPATGSNIADSDSGRTVHAYASAIAEEMAYELEGSVLVVVAVVWEFDTEQCLIDLMMVVDVDRGSVEPCATALIGVEALVESCLIDHAKKNLPLIAEGDANGERIEAVHIVGSAVERVDDPPAWFLLVCG